MRLALSAATTAGLLALRWSGQPPPPWAVVAASAVVFWAGSRVLLTGGRAMARGRPDAASLLALGTLAALVFGLLVAAAAITTLGLAVEALEQWGRRQSARAVQSLAGRPAETAHLIDDEDGSEADVPTARLTTGARLRVRPGETIPADGIVTGGEGVVVDESRLTGTVAAVKVRGDRVIAGTVNDQADLVMHADGVGSHTVAARIGRLLEESERAPTRLAGLVDRASARIAWGAIGVAAATGLTWRALGQPLAPSLACAIAVLVMAAPAPLALAAPMAFAVGVARGAGAGLLVHGARALERLARVDVLIVDRRGVLSEGRPRVVEIETLGTHDEPEALRLAASVERRSDHPLAAAIVSEAESRGIGTAHVTGFRTVPGLGVVGRVGRRDVAVGNAALFRQLTIDPEPLRERATALRQRGRTVVLVGIAHLPAAVIALDDPLPAATPEAVRRVRAAGMRVALVTGDHRDTVERLVKKLRLDDLVTDAHPARKATVVTRLRGEGKIVAVAGHADHEGGLLSLADVGIALGPEVTEGAGITLLRGDLRSVAQARALSRATTRVAWSNVALSVVVPAVGVPLAAGAWIGPLLAAALVGATALGVVGHAFSLRKLTL